MPETTRTAEEAARACGCAVSQIVKSLVFRIVETGGLTLLLVAGDRRVDVGRASGAVGGNLEPAGAKQVRDVTGFAIGGVSPLGHVTAIRTFMDPSLLEHDTVWVAAGTPNAVFSVAPTRLREAVGAELLPPEACRADA
ncbi:MAG TPA: YbaK/EbsC family protein [Candidatus Acidoferrales bacterium]|nr:YbaK/EbsC family protein [Candidatus Acidoferrales bacterium]